MASAAPAPLSPERIFAAFHAWQQTAALKAALDLGLFTAIASADGETTTATALARATAASERGIRGLADALTVYGFLAKHGHHYALTPESAHFLDRRSPAYIGSVADFLLSRSVAANFESLQEAVRKGGAPSFGDCQQPLDERWVSFAENMGSFVLPSVHFIADFVQVPASLPFRILDVAAGHGLFGIQFASRHANAHVTALDWPAVLEVARRNAERAGVLDRWTPLPGSVFDAELGHDYDLVLLTNILHHFDKSTCERLLRRIHAALKPGGRAITLDFVPNEDRVSPPMPALFTLQMLANTDHGDVYTHSEYQSMFRNAGFAGADLHSLPNSPQSLLVSQRLS
jgi:2-polyprenyl-3-methyl-5-hydroxy-6-metoxy-1,4-benzoquinol methylase